MDLRKITVPLARSLLEQGHPPAKVAQMLQECASDYMRQAAKHQHSADAIRKALKKKEFQA